jgi:YqaJ-like recombinase protein
MKFFDVEPRSEQWRTLRLGAVTSSNFDRILTPKTMKVSAQAKKYLAELLSEFITGEECESVQTQWMQRGTEVEDDIWRCYEAYTGTETQRGGYFCSDDQLIGASPDRRVGDPGLLEAKAPMLTTQILYGLGEGPDSDYLVQVQGQLMVSEREWVDIFSWHPKLFIPPIRVYRDEKFIAVLRPVLETFVEQMLEARFVLETKFGPFVRYTPEPPLAPDDPGALGVSDSDLELILAEQAKRLVTE